MRRHAKWIPRPSSRWISGSSSQVASKRRKLTGSVIRCAFALLIVTVLAFYISIYQRILVKNSPPTPPKRVTIRNSRSSLASKPSYTHWRTVATDLARLSPDKLMTELETKDPFGTRAIAKQLHQRKGETLSLEQLRLIYGCPEDRISLPDQRDAEKARKFRDGEKGYFLFFQHLRKAGGTNFCSLAEANFPKPQVPRYFCMPDYYWENKKCAGCLHHFTNKQITDNMGKYRIAGNEWESFDLKRHFSLPAAFVTSFRSPVDRALSQFRFECVESRGCKQKNVTAWWIKRRDLHNVYTWTFSDVDRQHRIAAAPEFASERADAVGKAMDTIAQFHLVLSMEWLRYAEDAVKTVLGFKDTKALTTYVRPHNKEKQRSDSWASRDKLDPKTFELFQYNLALDEILTDAARRFFWERLVCDGH